MTVVIRYDTIGEFNVDSKAEYSDVFVTSYSNLCHASHITKQENTTVNGGRTSHYLFYNLVTYCTLSVAIASSSMFSTTAISRVLSANSLFNLFLQLTILMK